MIAELISVGTELLMGQILDTNSQYLSQELNAMGFDVYYKSTVGDNPERMKQAFALAMSRSDIVITTGGLGPTEDDITKEMMAEQMGVPLVLHPPSLKEIQDFFERIGQPMTENNRKQAMLPAEGDGIIMPNPKGTAPGCIMHRNGKHAIVMPGPPFEMKYMFTQYAKSYLQQFCSDVLVSHYLRVVGLGESRVADLLQDVIETQSTPSLATYCSPSEVQIRITAKCKAEEEAESLIAPVEAKVRRILGSAVYTVGAKPLETVVGDLLKKRGETVAVAESCSGGWLSSLLIHDAGSSAYFKEGIVSYTNEAKHRLLRVSNDTLARYGAVSEQTAMEMAQGARENCDADYALSITGIAGPDGAVEGKPVGTVWIGLADRQRAFAKKFEFSSDRTRNRERAVRNALNLLRLELLKKEMKK